MNQSHIHTLYEHNYWARDRILAQLNKLPQATLREPLLPHDQTIMYTWTHVFNAECLWRQRLEQPKQPAPLRFPEPADSLAQLQEAWEIEQAHMFALIDRITHAQLDKIITYRSLGGRTFQNQAWQMLLQPINHGTRHRAELALLLTTLGHSPGDLDLIIYLRKEIA